MSYQEKSSVVSIFSTILIIGFYSLYVWGRIQDNGIDFINDYSFWGKTFLLLIPISIVANIIINIVFTAAHHIATKEEDFDLTDERDKLIELRSIRNSHYGFVLVFGIAMAALAIGMKPHIMFLILVYGGAASSLVSDISQLIYYRRGF